MDNQFNPATPEQQLRSLTAMLRTPVEIIRGFAEIIKLANQVNSIEPQGILREINTISEAADRIKIYWIRQFVQMGFMYQQIICHRLI
jgi:hypothetical protein